VNGSLAVRSGGAAYISGMEVQAMPDSVDEIVFAVGEALVAPGPGTAELILAALVALAFAASAVKTWMADGRPSRRRGRS
jgi:hypothetical protein